MGCLSRPFGAGGAVVSEKWCLPSLQHLLSPGSVASAEDASVRAQRVQQLVPRLLPGDFSVHSVHGSEHWRSCKCPLGPPQAGQVPGTLAWELRAAAGSLGLLRGGRVPVSSFLLEGRVSPVTVARGSSVNKGGSLCVGAFSSWLRPRSFGLTREGCVSVLSATHKHSP